MHKYVVQYSRNPTDPASWINFKLVNSRLDCYRELIAHLQAPRMGSSIQWTSGFRWCVSVGSIETVYRILCVKNNQDLEYSVIEYKRLGKEHNLQPRADS
jgi:hypothetical protein